MQLADISSYLISKGLGHMPKPMAWLNGLLHAIPTDKRAIESELGYAMMMESQQLQEHIYFGR